MNKENYSIGHGFNEDGEEETAKSNRAIRKAATDAGKAQRDKRHLYKTAVALIGTGKARRAFAVAVVD